MSWLGRLRLYDKHEMVSRSEIWVIIRFFFIFENELDVNRILMSEPWSFDKNLVALQRINEDVGKM